MTGRRRDPLSPARKAGLVGVGALLVLLALLPAATEPHVVNSIDTALKLIQAEELRRSSFRSMAISYPARDLDPEEHYLPFMPPFVFLSRGVWQSIFPSAYALLVALLLPLGPTALVGLSLIASATAVAAVQLLPGARWPAPWLALLATPLWLYALSPTEMPVALAFAMAALASASRVRGQPGDWISGILLGLAALLRDEMLLLGPALLYARTLTGGRLPALVRAAAATGVPLVVMATVDQAWFGRPMLAHLRHAVPGFDLLLPRAQARLPHLQAMTWIERLDTVGVYWLFGHGRLVAALGCLWLLSAHLGRVIGPWVVAAGAVTLAAWHAMDLAVLLQSPRIHGGLFRLSPFLLLALLPRPPGTLPSPLVRLTWLATATVVGVALLTLNTEGGKSTGPRLVIALWPLLAAAAADTLASYLRAARAAVAARLTAAAGLALVAGSLLTQFGIVLPLRADRAEGDDDAVRLVRAIGDRVIVNETMFEIQLTGPLYFERAIMLARPGQRDGLSRRLADAGVRSFTFVLRPGAGKPGAFPDYRRAETWSEGRYVIERWVRAAPGAP